MKSVFKTLREGILAAAPLKIKVSGLVQVYEAVCSSYHMGSTYWYLRRKAHGRIGYPVQSLYRVETRDPQGCWLAPAYRYRSF